MPPPADGFAARLVLGPALRAQPDRRLVSLVREGYETAFEEIVRRYGKPLTRYAGAIVGPRAEDVTQDAFSKALLALRRDGAEIELRPWLFRIVRNTALNDLRDSPPSAEALAEEIADGGSPAEVLERREELADLMRRLQSLPEAQRAAIVMRELEGLSHEEIAAALGLSGGAARQAIFRARRALRSGLGMLLPMPLLKALLAGATAAPVEAVAGAASVGGSAAGASVALKAVTATVLVAGAVGAGVAVHDRHPGRQSTAAEQEQARTSDFATLSAPGATNSKSSGNPGPSDDDRGRHPGSEGAGEIERGDDGDRRGGSSGPGSGNAGATEPLDHEGHSGGGPGPPGNGGGKGHGSSGGGGGDDSRSGGSGSSSGGSSDPGGGGRTSGGSDDHSGPGSGEPTDDGGTNPPSGELIETSGGSGSGEDGSGSSGSGDGSGGSNSGDPGDSHDGSGFSMQTEPQTEEEP
ncbi:MAG: RNA polymerase sigma factor [Solirubrobacterales bacterium]